MDQFLSCPDKELFEAVASGSEAAFRALFERYKTRVYNSAYKLIQSHHSAEEITQEIFIRLWIGRGGLLQVCDPAAYIYRAISNKVKDYLRNDRNREKILRNIRERENAFSNATEEAILANSSQQLIAAAIEKLPSRKRSIYCMNREEGKTIKEIASELHLSQHTVKTHLYEAIQVIRTYLKNAVALLLF